MAMQGAECRVQGAGCRVHGAGRRAQDARSRELSAADAASACGAPLFSPESGNKIYYIIGVY